MRFVLLLIAAGAFGREITLKEAVALALENNPEVVLRRLDEQKAAQAVHVARDPFTLRLGAGSGLAKSFGFPMSIEGQAPSIFEARANQALFNRPQSYAVAQARENARGASIDTAVKRDEVAHRVALLYLDAERAARQIQQARDQEKSAALAAETVKARVAEGRALPIDARRAELTVARARRRMQALESERRITEEALAVAIGIERAEVVVEADRTVPPATADEEDAIKTALAQSPELRRLESALLAKQLEIRSYRAARLPQINLVAQYALFAKFNNYEDYFQRFSRNNSQIGASFEVPLFVGSAPKALATQGEIDGQRIRTEMNQLRARIIQNTRTAYVQLKNAEESRELARLELDVAREQLSVLLAQMEEGRATLPQVEEARIAESERWLAFYDARYALERARIDILRYTGELTAALQ